VEPAEGKTRFHDLDLPVEILHAIADLGFQYATPIQAQILPAILTGRDGLGQAQTGTGKTAAFLCALFTRLLRHPPHTHRRPGLPRALILAPTRELAVQIELEAQEIGKYCGLTSLAVFGGQDYERQQRTLNTRIVDVVAATPGRLLDFKNSRDIDLSAVEVLVIDEADRMLDMGFIPDVRRIVRFTPPKERRQTLFFSATFSPEILRLGDDWTTDPARVHIASEKPAAETVDQAIYIAADREKLAIIYHVLRHENPERVLIFVNRRDHADRLCEALERVGVRSAILSGNVPQNKRMRTLEEFREGTLKVVVATDVAGRGLHIEGVSHVINYNLPEDPEDYVHRIGRTGRAGTTGKSISFASEMDAFAIPGIEKYLGRALTCTHPEEAWLTLPEELEAALRESGHSGGRHGLGRSRSPRPAGGGGFRRGPSRGGPRRR
jgi:ATP-dependent RNA helicase RhlB